MDTECFFVHAKTEDIYYIKILQKMLKKDLTLQILGRRLFEEKNFKKSNWINERLIR